MTILSSSVIIGRKGSSRRGTSLLSEKKISNRKNFTTDKKERTQKPKMFHLETRKFQIFNINDPVWVVAPPVCVFNKYQLPIALSPTYDSTVDNTGGRIICLRFCWKLE